MTTTEARLVPVPEPGNLARRGVTLQAGTVGIGRGGRNQIVLEDPSISKHHAEFAGAADGFVLRDLGSSNGTFVNGARIREHRLVPGDLVTFGDSRFRFEQGGQRERPSVTIVASSPLERSRVLATVQMQALLRGDQLREADLRGRYDRVRLAFEAVRKLIETTDVRLLCERILETAFSLVDAENGAVLLFDGDGELVPWATRAAKGHETGDLVISRTLVEQVTRAKQSVLAADALSDARWSSARSIVLSGTRSLMCVPLMSADRVHGLLHVGNSSVAGAFSESDLELLSGVGAGAGVALSNAFMTHRLAEEARTRESLGRFLSPVLVEEVMQNRMTLTRGGEERYVTVMFADIRGFTTLTERRKPQEVVALLNECFDQMVEVVFHYGGVLDKYIGDALMAVWGIPARRQDDAVRALAAARDMQQTLASLNKLRVDRGDEPVGVGVGLASGLCVTGAVGARRRMEYTAIGDAVNLASRLAGIARAGEVICDQETFRYGGKPMGAVELPPAQVKGKSKPVPLYRVCGEEV